MKRIAIIAGTAQTLLSLTPAAPCIKPLLLTAVLLQTLCGAAGLALQGRALAVWQKLGEPIAFGAGLLCCLLFSACRHPMLWQPPLRCWQGRPCCSESGHDTIRAAHVTDRFFPFHRDRAEWFPADAKNHCCKGKIYMKKQNKRLLWSALGFFAAFALWTVLVCRADVRPIGPNGSCAGLAALNGVPITPDMLRCHA